MKATTIILAAVLTFTANILFASNETNSGPVSNANITLTIAALAPEVPAEADFSDAFIVEYTSLAPVTPAEADFNDAFIVDFTSLAPITPADAQFEEMTYETVITLNLAPVTPSTAGFDEAAEYSSLAPVLPAEADFE